MKKYIFLCLFLFSLTLNATQPTCKDLSSSSIPTNEIQELVKITKKQLMNEYKKIEEFSSDIIAAYGIKDPKKIINMKEIIKIYKFDLSTVIVFLLENDFESAYVYLSGLFIKYPEFEDLKEPIENLEKILELEEISFSS